MTFHPFESVDKSACLKCTSTEKRESKWSRKKSVPTSLMEFLQSVKRTSLITEHKSKKVFVLKHCATYAYWEYCDGIHEFFTS